VTPIFTRYNVMYRQRGRDAPDRLMRFAEGLNLVGTELQANQPNGHCYLADEMMVWFRNLAFLNDPAFIDAVKPCAGQKMIHSKLWRIYTYCWAVKATAPLNGTCLDLGCYHGATTMIANRYAPDRHWWLIDAFDHHPNGGDKPNHGPELYEKTKAIFRGLGDNVTVTRGLLPGALDDAFQSWKGQSFSFVHLDLNDGAVEVQCLERVWPKIVSGGIVLLDDYGWKTYALSQKLHDDFFRSVGHTVYENPTGQGMVVKR
jgi:O-methyltransferase